MEKLKVTKIHFEITNRCNAACPGCPRTGVNNGLSDVMVNWGMHDLPLEMFQDILLSKRTLGMHGILYCGNFGDPIAHPKVLDFWEFAASIGVKRQQVDTNGSLRTPEWWARAGKVKGLEVTFAIDGLRDTNHIYRQNTNYDKIIENAKAFMSTGGKANWQFIVFGHNEHQVDEAKSIARELGFSEFKTKKTARPLNRVKEYKKSSKSEVKEIKITAPKNAEYKTRELDHNNKLDPNQIPKCMGFQVRNDIYVSADGVVLPCCWVAKDFVVNHFPDPILLSDKELERDGFYSKLIESGTKYNLHDHSFDDIIDSYESNMDYFQEQWNKQTISICNQKCAAGLVNKVELDAL
jgi:MoaA/NifB/PqqE/SkfB family radical SAM enzyme